MPCVTAQRRKFPSMGLLQLLLEYHFLFGTQWQHEPGSMPENINKSNSMDKKLRTHLYDTMQCHPETPQLAATRSSVAVCSAR